MRRTSDPPLLHAEAEPRRILEPMQRGRDALLGLWRGNPLAQIGPGDPELLREGREQFLRRRSRPQRQQLALFFERGAGGLPESGLQLSQRRVFRRAVGQAILEVLLRGALDVR